METRGQKYYNDFVDLFLNCKDFSLSLFEKTVSAVAESNTEWVTWDWNERITAVQSRLDKYYDDRLLTSYEYQELFDYLRFAGGRIITFLLD